MRFANTMGIAPGGSLREVLDDTEIELHESKRKITEANQRTSPMTAAAEGALALARNRVMSQQPGAELSEEASRDIARGVRMALEVSLRHRLEAMLPSLALTRPTSTGPTSTGP